MTGWTSGHYEDRTEQVRDEDGPRVDHNRHDLRTLLRPPLGFTLVRHREGIVYER